VPDTLRHLPAGSQYHSGAHVVAHAIAQRDALHQYRDEATLKLRAYQTQFEREGRVHRFWRRRAASMPRLSLPQDCRDILAKWREPARVSGLDHEVAVDDPTRDEPKILELERGPLP
jgi:hypothetical protein